MVAPAAHLCVLHARYDSHQDMLICGIYGIYVPLFLIALWATLQGGTRASKVMGAVLFMMFAVVTTQFSLILCLGADTVLDCSTATSSFTYRLFYINPYILDASIAISSMLSDGVLAWRCYVLYGNRRWMKWLLVATFVIIGASGVYMSVHPEQPQGFSIFWSPIYLTVNTALTSATAAKIFIIHKKTPFKTSESRSLLFTVGLAIVESSLISWIGAFVMLVLQLAPSSVPSDVNNGMRYWLHVGFAATLPTIFGISQTLLIARVAFSRLAKSCAGPSPGTGYAVFTSQIDVEKGVSRPAIPPMISTTIVS